MSALPRHVPRGASWAAAALLAMASTALAQLQAPHIAYVFPAGGQRGGMFRIAVGGQHLSNVTGAYVSGEGVTAKVIEVVWTLNAKQRDSLARTLAILEKARPTLEIVDSISEIRKEIATQRPSSPALADTVIVEASVAPDAAPGPRALRLATRSGLSNPLVFDIGVPPEVNELEPPEVPFDVLLQRAVGDPVPIPDPTPSEPRIVKLPAVVNGQILPGSADWYRFQARRGQAVVVVVEARSLTPYLADGVPGWFQAAVSVVDAKGRELGYADHFRFQPDPVLCVEIPETGEYAVEIRDAIYRGREDFVYRMTLGEFPFITDIFPLGGRTGTKASLEARGWNLPADRITQDATALAPGVHLLPPLKDSQAGNRIPFDVGDLPEVREARSHGSPAHAQAVKLPAIVNGRIDTPGQWDVFRFQARPGEEIVAQVRARRLGSPLDSVLMLTDANGAPVASNDDYGDNRDDGLETHHADSYLRAHLATGGTYYLHLGDIQQQGGPEYAYRLRLSAPHPDFELRIAPSAINLSPGENVPVAVYALRKDGFAGDIELSLSQAPKGVFLDGGRIGASQDWTRVTLAALPTVPRGNNPIRLQGRATIAGQDVVREALPAEDMMQAFLWRHLVPAQDLQANVPPGTEPRRPIKLIGGLPVEIPAGTSAAVRVAVNLADIKADGPVQFELVDPPDGISVQASDPAAGSPTLVLACDSKKLKPGFQGNLIAVAYVMVTPPPQLPFAIRPRRDPADLLKALKEAPASPDKDLSKFVRADPDLDRMAADLDSKKPAASMPAAAAREPEPAPLVPRPPQKVTLGTLPAITFKIVKP